MPCFDTCKVMKVLKVMQASTCSAEELFNVKHIPVGTESSSLAPSSFEKWFLAVKIETRGTHTRKESLDIVRNDCSY
jgi:hypothetical protein